MVRALVAVTCLAACYKPSVEDCAYQCAAADPRCPSGLSCEQSTNLCRPPGASGTCGSGIDAGCTDPRKQCGSDCVDITQDPMNCGECGRACPSGRCINRNCAHRVFVTNAVVLNGDVDDADARCQTAADARMLGGTFVAWLSRQGKSPETVLVDDGGAYVLINGDVIADNWADLTDGMLDFNVEITEFGIPYTGAAPNVWTNTSATGQALETTDTTKTCSDFTTANSTHTGVYGRLDRRDAMWTIAATSPCCCGTGCDACPAHLYCFEN